MTVSSTSTQDNNIKMSGRSEYKVGVVLSVEECSKSKGGKTLRACKVNIGDADNPITVVTAASNVRDNSRIVVAPVGSTVLDESGEAMQIKKTSVAGVMSEGMFCDSPMLGWKGGAQGVAATVPDTYDVGSAPPSEKPRPKGQVEESPVVGMLRNYPGCSRRR